MSDERWAKVSGDEEVTVLVERARLGDRNAFDRLVRRYRPRIFALALHMTGSRAEADDVTQDTFIRACRHLDRFEGRSHFFTWLYRIAIHRALNSKRDAKRKHRVMLDDERVAAAIAVDGSADPRLQLELKQTYTQLLSAFDALSPTLRTTVALVALQGLDHKQAASVLGTHEGTIAWRIHEARGRLRTMIEAMHRPKLQPTASRMKAAEVTRGTRSPALSLLGRKPQPS